MSWVVRDEFLATIVPYVLGLGCAFWLFNADGSTRWAAFWALLVALARIVGPIALASMSDAEIPGGQHYVDWQTLRILVWFQDFQMLALGVMVWAVVRALRRGERRRAGGGARGSVLGGSGVSSQSFNCSGSAVHPECTQDLSAAADCRRVQRSAFVARSREARMTPAVDASVSRRTG